MKTYVAYRLGIRSEIPLPDLLGQADAPADVTIRRGAVEYPDSRRRGTGSGLLAASGEIRFWLDGVGTFLIRDGRMIQVDAASGADDELLLPTILGPAMGLLLHQRGLATFHGSSVSIDGRAAIFLGAKGFGKSTLAAALHARGHALLADDISVVESKGSEPIVLPGYPTFKLWPDSARALGTPPESLRPLHGQTDKLLMEVSDGFPVEPVPLGGVYLLGDDSEPGETETFERLGAPSAVLELLPHWYAAMSGLPLIRALGLSAHFRQCGAIAQGVPIFHFRQARAFEALAATAKQLEAHFRGIGPRD